MTSSRKRTRRGGIDFSRRRFAKKGGKQSKRRFVKRVQTPKKRRLNLRKIIEFKYEMDYILEDLPETAIGTIKGSIIAKADKIDQDAAIEFIKSKVEEGILTEETAERLGRLLHDHCFYR